MAEYWPSSFCRRRWSQGPLTCTRNEQHQYPAILTGHACSIEDLLCEKSTLLFSCGYTADNPEWAR